MNYSIPEHYETRLHHVRPRFKNNMEDVLLYMASEIQCIGKMEHDGFKACLNNAIRRFPGNFSRTQKTINNWRTEISSLLGLIRTEAGFSYPSAMSEQLTKKQDLTEFFKFFCFKFQYPGGHLKPAEIKWMLDEGIRFKPAKYILSVLHLATVENGNRIGLTKMEVTHCIFNDLRVSRDNRSPQDTLSLILDNRAKELTYESGGDVVRYAGDILDYMELANLVTLKPNGMYYLETSHVEVIASFLNSECYFEPYEPLYSTLNVTLNQIKETMSAWFDYVNQDLDGSLFETDIAMLFGDNLQIGADKASQQLSTYLVSLQSGGSNVTTKQIGDTGEAIAIRHEYVRLDALDRLDLAKKVIKIPENQAVGYDLHSYSGEGLTKRFIEVKTTISRKRTTIKRFQMTPNEWSSAEQFGDDYYIYRLSLSTEGLGYL